MLAQQLLHPDFLESQRRRDPFLEFLRQFRLRDAVTKQPWQVLLHIWMRSHFPGYVLAAERLDAYHAVEMRLPFLDPSRSAASCPRRCSTRATGTRRCSGRSPRPT